MDILRGAIAKVANDPELKADAKKMMLDMNYISGNETLRIVNDVLNQLGPISATLSLISENPGFLSKSIRLIISEIFYLTIIFMI